MKNRLSDIISNGNLVLLDSGIHNLYNYTKQEDHDWVSKIMDSNRIFQLDPDYMEDAVSGLRDMRLYFNYDTVKTVSGVKGQVEVLRNNVFHKFGYFDRHRSSEVKRTGYNADQYKTNAKHVKDIKKELNLLVNKISHNLHETEEAFQDISFSAEKMMYEEYGYGTNGSTAFIYPADSQLVAAALSSEKKGNPIDIITLDLKMVDIYAYSRAVASQKGHKFYDTALFHVCIPKDIISYNFELASLKVRNR